MSGEAISNVINKDFKTKNILNKKKSLVFQNLR